MIIYFQVTDESMFLNLLCFISQLQLNTNFKSGLL